MSKFKIEGLMYNTANTGITPPHSRQELSLLSYYVVCTGTGTGTVLFLYYYVSILYHHQKNKKKVKLVVRREQGGSTLGERRDRYLISGTSRYGAWHSE